MKSCNLCGEMYHDGSTHGGGGICQDCESKIYDVGISFGADDYGFEYMENTARHCRDCQHELLSWDVHPCDDCCQSRYQAEMTRCYFKPKTP